MTGSPNKAIEKEDGITFGPWKKGLNTLHQDSELERDELRWAMNVDITNGGHVRRRKGSYSVYSGAGIHSVGPSLLFAEGANLKRYDPKADAATTLYSGLTPGLGLVYERVNDQIYWSNTVQTGRVDSGTFTNSPWGLQVPNAPTAVAASGGILTIGSYQIVISYSNAAGEESGTGVPTVVDVPINNGAIAITVLPQPQSGQGITTINVYVSSCNGGEAYWHGSVATGVTTYAITSVDVTKRSARNRYLTPPPAGKLLSNESGRIYIAVGSSIHWTEPLGYNLYNPARNSLTLDGDIKVMRAVAGGIWAVTDGATFWLPGDDPSTFKLEPKADYSAPLQTAVDIPDTKGVAWLSYRGWVTGSQDGELKNLAENRVGVNQSPTRAVTLYREQNSIRQFVGLVAGSTKPVVNSDDFNAL